MHSQEPAPGAPYDHRQFGAPVAAGDLLLSFCIPTYKRAPRVRALLAQLERILARSPHRGRVEIVVSNNASPDATDEYVLERAAALAPLCQVRYYKQTVNIGGEANFKFLYEHAQGEYVWISSDDDILEEDQFDRLIDDLDRHRPELCLSSFRQPPWTEENRMFMCGGEESQMVTELADAIPHLVRLPKLTAYVYRRRDLTPAEQEVSDRASRTTNFWFVALSVLLFANRGQRLLLRSATVAHSGPDFRDLNFSPRVLGSIVEAVRLGLGGHPEADRLVGLVPVPDVTTAVVGTLFRHCVGLNRLDGTVAREDYRFVLGNVPAILRSGWRNGVKLPFVLALFPLVNPWRGRAYGPAPRDGKG